MRRKARQQADAADASSGDIAGSRAWMFRGLRDIVPPLALVIWIHGVYLATRLLLDDVTPDRWVPGANLALA